MTATVAPQPPRNVAALLVRLRDEAFSGAVVVTGPPGGSIYLRDGLVIAAETPGAPGVESLLLKSRRVSEDDWTAARAGLPSAGTMARALAARAVIGGAELEVVCVAAVYDAAFAMALSPAGGWSLIEAAAPPDLVLDPGIDPERLTAETTRRRAALARYQRPLGELAAARIKPAARVEGRSLSARHRDILLTANGRRTPRDIAFALGRGVYPVMLDLGRMSARDLVQWDEPADAPVPSVAPRRAAAADPAAKAGAANGAPLPRRTARRERRVEGLTPDNLPAPSVARHRGRRDAHETEGPEAPR